MVPKLGFVDPITAKYIYLNDDENSSIVGEYITYLLERKMYIKFLATATQAQVYNLLSAVTGGTDTKYISSSGRFGEYTVAEIVNDGDGDINFKDNGATIVLTAYSGSSTQLGHVLQADFIITAI